MLFGTQRTGLDVLLDRPRPNKWQQFWSKPYIFLAHFFYSLRQITHEPLANPISIVCISDTHNSQPRLPFGDVLIHAGDLTQSGSLGELKATIAWLNSQTHTHTRSSWQETTTYCSIKAVIVERNQQLKEKV
ncbi:hypothetical protein FNYG_07014 [Fusarium nygamai]|uniref:Calcineurin-like phosphoesterase domain-containing protein n=1 Tax=Gibberella nygamai TaxID=42673 RepID=A0A2K0WBK7_GIBNY|nr:hypothetical protein FNYG_07014 [Fusarium nygamai]